MDMDLLDKDVTIQLQQVGFFNSQEINISCSNVSTDWVKQKSNFLNTKEIHMI
jgi:hypothetical protein